MPFLPMPSDCLTWRVAPIVGEDHSTLATACPVTSMSLGTTMKSLPEDETRTIFLIHDHSEPTEVDE
jgi:hypothetical protein